MVGKNCKLLGLRFDYAGLVLEEIRGAGIDGRLFGFEFTETEGFKGADHGLNKKNNKDMDILYWSWYKKE